MFSPYKALGECTNRVHTECIGLDLVELNIQPDHVYPLTKVLPKASISKLMGALKGRAALQIQILRQF
ncbi:MAG: hypothetical protein GY814_17595 [Gammaproteobacteria bacterium]|nr:hypothetical protein [Gammaproteobacteria bacterium]